MNYHVHLKPKNFLFALNGLKEAAATQVNFRIHIIAVIAAISTGIFFNISITEWCLLFFSAGLVIAAECFNTALEYLIDLVSPQFNTAAGKIKDLAAAGVLIASVTAAITGGIIFIPKLYFLLI